MSESNNKRVVKKSKTKKMSIKVSTEDKDSPMKNNLNGDKNSKSKGSNPNKTETKEETLEMRVSKLLENNQNLEKELNIITEQLKSEKEDGFKDLDNLNKEINNLNKSQTKASKDNKNLLNKLKKMEEEVSKKFQDKFKISRVIEKQKAIAQERDINKEIKSKENEKNNVQKDIKINKKEIDRLNKILEENQGEGEKKLDQQYLELKEKIDTLQKEVDGLNLIKFQHKYCSKNTNILKNKLNVLTIDYEFEAKRKTMISSIPPKIEKERKEEEDIQRINYGNTIRRRMLKSTKNKYDSKKVQTINHRSYNFLQNELNKNLEKKRNNSSNKNRNQEIEVEKSNKKEGPNVYLFTEAEKEVFKKLVPNSYFNNVNEKANQKESELKEIEENNQEQKILKKKLYMDNLRYDEINLKQKELRMIKNNLMSNHIKNNKKIIDMKNQIKKMETNITRENKKIERIVIKNNNLKEIIDKFKQKLKEENGENEENEDNKEAEE